MKKFSSFEAFRFGIGYTIVDKSTLDPVPLSAFLLDELSSESEDGIPHTGPIEWIDCNAAHQVTARAMQFVVSPERIYQHFTEAEKAANRLLAPRNAKLISIPMHPWMSPLRNVSLMLDDGTGTRKLMHKVCRFNTNGWVNTQRLSISFAYDGDAEFGRLIAALRVAMPMIPAISAASPFIECQRGRYFDNQIDEYRKAAVRMRHLAGHVIPEAIFTEQEYVDRVLGRVREDLNYYDTKKIVNPEDVNGRAVVAHIDAGTIDLKLADVQSTPFSNMAVAHAIIMLVRCLAEEKFCSLGDLKIWSTRRLARHLRECCTEGENTHISDGNYAKLYNLPKTLPRTYGYLWYHLYNTIPAFNNPTFRPFWASFFTRGSIATQFVRAVGGTPAPRPALERFLRTIY